MYWDTNPRQYRQKLVSIFLQW